MGAILIRQVSCILGLKLAFPRLPKFLLLGIEQIQVLADELKLWHVIAKKL